MKTKKQNLMTVGLAAMMALPGYSAEKPDASAAEATPVEAKKTPIVQVNKGYNDISVGLSEEGLLIRTISSVEIDFAGLNLSYNGLNQINDFNTDTYFGLQRIGLTTTDFKATFKPTVRLVTTADGIVDSKIGFETGKIANLYKGSNNLIELLDVDYGYAGLYTDGNNHTAHAFLGHNLKPLAEMSGYDGFNDMSVETIISKSFGDYEAPTFWEVTVAKPFTEHASGFIQTDSSNTTYAGVKFIW